MLLLSIILTKYFCLYQIDSVKSSLKGLLSYDAARLMKLLNYPSNDTYSLVTEITLEPPPVAKEKKEKSKKEEKKRESRKEKKDKKVRI